MLLLIATFISATLWPMGSEVLYVALLLEQPERFLRHWLIASFGNTLGAACMLLLARIASQQSTKYLAKLQPSLQAKNWLERFGTPLLALSWLPVIGDLLPIAAGWLRLNWLAAMFWLTLGKSLRFAVLGWLVV